MECEYQVCRFGDKSEVILLIAKYHRETMSRWVGKVVGVGAWYGLFKKPVYNLGGPAAETKSCIVIGGGVIGVCTAYSLAAKGFEVTVIEKESSVSPPTSASFGNAGCLRPSSREAVVSASAMSQLGGSMFYFSPRVLIDIDFIAWGLEFLYRCVTIKDVENTIGTCVDYSIQQMDKVLKKENICDQSFGMTRKDGALVLLASDKDDKDVEVQGKLLDRKQVLELEPVLAGNKAFNSGILHGDDRFASCPQFTKILANICKNKYNVRFMENVQAVELNKSAERVTGVRCKRGDDNFVVSGDAFVVCCGAESPELLKSAGYSTFPVFPMQGYTLRYPHSKPGATKRVIIDSATHLFMTPFKERTQFTSIARFVPTTEIKVGVLKEYDEEEQKIIAHIKECAKAAFPDLVDYENETPVVWAGSRPQTPDDLPIVSSTNTQNLFVNTGHSSRGWVMSMGTAHLVSALVAGERLGPEQQNMCQQLSLSRFALYN